MKPLIGAAARGSSNCPSGVSGRLLTEDKLDRFVMRCAYRSLAWLPALPFVVRLQARSRARISVMIARGDLAVECGYERLAEAQEEILWICEAAHCPAIWATQVLESLAKEGTPSRAEITDAAMGHRAECVMLNKGPHIDQAVRVLDDILRRMDAHQSKKRAMLRSLRLATDFNGVTVVARGRASGPMPDSQPAPPPQ